MRINTDGVILGALAQMDSGVAGVAGVAGVGQRRRILDVGTGTGVIALMLAQRFEHAHIDAIEIDPAAAETARENFEQSIFRSRIRAFSVGVEEFQPSQDVPHLPNGEEEGVYDLIVSNPPFFLNSLKNPDKQREIARHASPDFFQTLLERAERWLTRNGQLQLILPSDLALKIQELALERTSLRCIRRRNVFSFAADEEAVRTLISFVKREDPQELLACAEDNPLIIYQERSVYTDAYRDVLRDFFLAF